MITDSGTSLMVVVVEESCYAMKGSSPQTRREDDDANVIFQVAGVRSVQEWPQHTTDIIVWEFSMHSLSLSRLKSKYPWFFSSRWVSRDPGTDISALFNMHHNHPISSSFFFGRFREETILGPGEWDYQTRISATPWQIDLGTSIHSL